ncbi:stage II sporulation protein P [Paenibacillus glycinis]|uniref:Stage II sporulation protein P n=1 Tax=Paenibacillus glycinis TaxID=2697035 RepID=A0ABW9XJV6_9BACL|nr:stage II sporulation protein P [Paenibacillus glycinis]NBD22888.1 stage II sporulation protein P [Paenibacillus glycinis]
MKRVIMTLNIGRSSLRLRQLLIAGRTFALLSLGSMVLVLVVGIGVIVQQRASTSPVASMKGFAASVSSGLFADMLAMEMPGTAKTDVKPSISGHQIGSFLVRLLTDINPDDPKSLLASQYPGLDGEKTTLLQGGSGTDASVGPEDHETVTGSDDGNGGIGEGTDAPDGLNDADRPDHDPGDIGTVDGGEATDTPEDASGDTPIPADPAKPTTSGRNVVFIYHSHARESWFPEVKSKKTAESSTRNITLLGTRLANQLDKLGIGSLHSATDYPTAVKNYNWLLSYKYSKQSVLTAMADNKDLKFFFDIHRDSQHRKETTATIGGRDYAQVFFIIGHGNPDWKRNEAFASEIHDELERKYPGLSRGIWGKTTANGNGEYNQSLAADSVLIEIGGVDNTLAESYRTVDALAKVIADLYWKDEKVTAPEATTK